MQLIVSNATDFAELNSNMQSANSNEYNVKWEKGTAEILKLGNHQFQLRLPLLGEEFNYQIIW